MAGNLAYGLECNTEKYFTRENLTVVNSQEGLRKALAAHGLLYRVEMHQMKNPLDGKDIPFFASVRMDTGKVLGAGLTDRYHPIQNEDGFSLIADLAAQNQGETLFARGMTFDKGRVAVAQIDLGEMIIGDTGRAGFKDVVRKRVTWTNSHDGSGAAQIFTTPIRIVCANTLTAAMGRTADAVKIRHSESAEDKMKEARKILKIVNGELTRAEVAYQVLAKTKITNEHIKDVLAGLFPTEGKSEKKGGKQAIEAVTAIQHFIKDADGGKIDPSTGWNTYNGITRYFDHHSPVRAHGEVKDYAEARAASTLTGNILAKNSQALKLLVDRLEVGDEIDRILKGVETSQAAAIAAEMDAPAQAYDIFSLEVGR